jgi:DNA-binding NarL/FixJ family response regulator
MKALVLVPKCRRTKGLAVRRTFGEYIWRRMCLTIGEDGSDQKDRRARQTPNAGQTTKENRTMDIDGMKVTPRDQQVLDLLVQGCNNKEIAGQLNISPRTVKQHLRTLFLRAGIRDGRKRVKLAIAAFEREEGKAS